MRKFKITVNGNIYHVEVEEEGVSNSRREIRTAAAPVAAPAPVSPVVTPPAAPVAASPMHREGHTVTAPLPGKITFVDVKPGQQVKRNDEIMILEAMKMENPIMAPEDGVIMAVHVKTGQAVQGGDPLYTIG
jgi:biotin carboxyl carrier protein